MRSGRSSAIVVLVACALAILSPACAEERDIGRLQELDFTLPKDSEARFDRNDILDTATLTDATALDVPMVRAFFAKTPYARRTFLATYASNGARAADAIIKASIQYSLNPILFLVLAQATEGLIGEETYPFPPTRVEFAFRCGCLQGDNCVAALAGFDRQVDCVGRSIRAALDQLSRDGESASGWAVDRTSTTLDGLKVTPANAATVALYDYLPRVNNGELGGLWLFWTVWQVYADALRYSGPLSDSPSGGRWIGDACETPEQCTYAGATCATDYPGGICTASCGGDDCPVDFSKPEVFCAEFVNAGGFCLRVCNPDDEASCRAGFSCVRLRRFGATEDSDSKHVCIVQ